MRKLITTYCLLFIGLLLGSQAKAQQLSQYSQYLNNYYLVNTAATDIQNSVQSFLAYRMGDGNYSGSPKTLYLSAYMPLKKPAPTQFMRSAMRVTGRLDTSSLITKGISEANHLVGMTMTTDQLGLFQKTTIHASYTYHLSLSKNWRLAASPKIGWVNMDLADDLTVYEDDDQPFQDFVNRYQRMNMADIGFGLWLYSRDFFFGYSIEQLVKGKAFSNLDDMVGYEFSPHHYLLIGTRLQISPRWALVPNVMTRAVADAPINFDVSVKAEYGSRLWAGLSYRKKTALVLMVGGKVSDQLSFSYSFDHTVNATRANQISAHEISLQFQFLQNLY